MSINHRPSYVHWNLQLPLPWSSCAWQVHVVPYSAPDYNVCGIVPTSPSNSWTPAVQHHCDTICLETASDLTGSVIQDCPATPFHTLIPSPGTHSCFWPASLRLEVPTALCLSSINLLEWITELRETFYLLDHWFIIKGCNSGIARWKRCTRHDKGKGHGAPMPPPSVLLPPKSPRVH